MALDILHTWGPDNVGQLLTSTHEKRGKKEVANAIFNRIPTLEYLNSKGKIMLDGGASIVLPLEVAANTTARFYDVTPTSVVPKWDVTVFNRNVLPNDFVRYCKQQGSKIIWWLHDIADTRYLPDNTYLLVTPTNNGS